LFVWPGASSFFSTIDWESNPPTGKQLIHREYLFMPNAAYRAALGRSNRVHIEQLGLI
jgi:hypothetical protein